MWPFVVDWFDLYHDRLERESQKGKRKANRQTLRYGGNNERER